MKTPSVPLTAATLASVTVQAQALQPYAPAPHGQRRGRCRGLAGPDRHGAQGQHGACRAGRADQVNFRNNRNGRTLTVDGIYGPKTQAAVRTFQQGVAFDVRGFPVDGVTGPRCPGRH